MEAITIAQDEKFLRQKSKKVSFPDTTLTQDIEIVKDYLKTHDNCFAVASIQLGIPKQLIIVKSTSTDCIADEEKDWIIMINPTIISQSGRTEYWEACLSCLSNVGLVKRPYKMCIRYYDVFGNCHKQQFEGFSCTVLSHELDHLLGILHMDRAKKVLQLTKEERIQLRKNNPYKIISKDGKFIYD